MATEAYDNVKPLLKKLATTVSKSFYRLEETLIMDLIIKEGSVTCDRIQELLKFDRRLMEKSLQTLKDDRMIFVKAVKVLNSENRIRLIRRYYIKYGQLVNVVKYKLSVARKRIEKVETDATFVQTYRCHRCNRNWTDMEAGELFDVNKCDFLCIFCGRAVVLNIPDDFTSAGLLMAKFNEQMGPIYDIIKEIEDALK